MAAELVGQRPADAEGGSNDDAPLVTADALPTLAAFRLAEDGGWGGLTTPSCVNAPARSSWSTRWPAAGRC